MKGRIYEEKQSYRKWEIIALLSTLIIGLAYCTLETYLQEPSNSGVVILSLILFMGFLGIGLFYFSSVRLYTKMNDKGISFSYYPQHYKNQRIKWSEIHSSAIVNTSMAAQWNGFNVSFNNQTAFSVSGTNGILITKKNGEEIFIGSQRAEEMKSVIDEKIG
ncbi:MAG: hypothetical protein ACPG5P_05845 [Saprospiraceae bacterium]